MQDGRWRIKDEKVGMKMRQIVGSAVVRQRLVPGLTHSLTHSFRCERCLDSDYVMAALRIASISQGHIALSRAVVSLHVMGLLFPKIRDYLGETLRKDLLKYLDIYLGTECLSTSVCLDTQQP